MKNSFFLIIPPQISNPEKLKSFKDMALQQWVDELPYANYGLAVQLFYDQIIEMNKTEMDAGFRLDAMEVLRPNFLGIQEYLRSRITKAGFPKTENEQKIYKVLSTLEKEFALGYWIIVKEFTKKSISWLKGRETALAVQRVVKGLSEFIVSSYLMRVPVADWVWIDLHSLFKLSVRINKSAVKISDQSCSFGKSISIEDAYKQIILLSMVKPGGLRQKEILQIYRFIERFASSLLFEEKAVEGQKNQFVLLTDEDKPAMLAKSLDSDSSMVFLNFSKISVLLSQKNKWVNAENPRFSALNIDGSNLEKLPQELVDYIELCWSGSEIDSPSLFTDRQDRYFSIGLAPTHELLSNMNHDQDIEYLAETASEKSLFFKSKIYGLLSIGSLISCRKNDSPETERDCGIIRKLSMTSVDSKVELEIQLLANRISPVKYAEVHETEGDEVKIALFFVKTDNDQNRSYLINESYLHKNGDIIRLYLEDENYPVVLGNRKNVGLGYWQFECRRVNEPEKQTVTKKKGFSFI
ncbi:MAG: hypothetical protein ACU833_02465 [Gammaproteobacteria bacterium]